MKPDTEFPHCSAPHTALFKTLLTLLAVWSAWAFTAPGAMTMAGGWAESWESIRQSSGDLKSIQAAFTQEKHMKILARPLVSKGRFYYQSPASLRWEYMTPVRSLLIVHGEETRRYYQQGDKMVEDSGMQRQSMQIVLKEISRWLNGHFNDNPGFKASLEPGKKITLVPREKAFAAFIEKIELNLSEQPGVLESVVIYETRDSYTRMTFENVVANQKISEALFKGI